VGSNLGTDDDNPHEYAGHGGAERGSNVAPDAGSCGGAVDGRAEREPHHSNTDASADAVADRRTGRRTDDEQSYGSADKRAN